MKNIFNILVDAFDEEYSVALATIIDTSGSTPQVQGASAIFSKTKGLISGTLGGGILEGKAQQVAVHAIDQEISLVFEYTLETDITSDEGALCGGKARILIDNKPSRYAETFAEMVKSLQNNKPGVLATIIEGSDPGQVDIRREWIEGSSGKIGQGDPLLQNYHDNLLSSIRDKKCQLVEIDSNKSPAEKSVKNLFLQPAHPLPKLVIAGAGHIGKALSHLANLLDFEVTVIDDRQEYANMENIPDADHIVVEPIGTAMKEINYDQDTFVVIVTRGHRDDADALRACIHSNAGYIGMIGSKRKIKLMRDEFRDKGWAGESQFNRVYAPIGLEIQSKTVQEIAVSISAQLVRVRREKITKTGKPVIGALILAAGGSKRMGKPKMLMPFGDSTIIEQIIHESIRSLADSITIVTGANSDKITEITRSYPVNCVENADYSSGMITSVRTGVSSLKDETVAILVLLGDQPMITASVVDKLITAYYRSEKGIIQACYKGKRGHPVIIDSKYYDEILRMGNSESLRDLISAHPEDVYEVETGSPETLRDIDTIEDYNYEIKNIKNHD